MNSKISSTFIEGKSLGFLLEKIFLMLWRAGNGVVTWWRSGILVKVTRGRNAIPAAAAVAAAASVVGCLDSVGHSCVAGPVATFHAEAAQHVKDAVQCLK